jgi:hypothetical protein
MDPNSAEMPIFPKLGGLPKLLGALERDFDFSAPQYGRWGKHRHTVWRLQGTWKREHLLRLLPAQQAAIRNGTAPDLTKLPEHLPDQVVLILGFDDLFPYRIEYRRSQPADDEQTPPVSIVLLGIEFYNVQFNLTFGRTQFIYEPGEVQFTDVTDSFLQSLGAK